MNYGVHGVLLFLHVFCKGDLAAGADDVVVVFFDLEVFVAGDVVVQEAGGEFAGEDEAAHAQRVDFVGCEDFGGLAQEAVCKSPKDVEVDAGFVRVLAVFLGEVRGKANGVAEIVGHEARHDGVQVDDDDGLSGGLIEQDVVDFGVVVGDANRKLSPLFHIGQLAGELLNAQKVVQLFLHVLYAAEAVLLRVLDERFVTLARIVEIRDGVAQLRRVKVGQGHLEIAEGFGRGADDVKAITGVVGDRGNVVAHTPEFVALKNVGVAVGSVVIVQTGLLRILPVDVLRHLVDVVHQGHRVLEGVGVDLLNQIAFDARHAGAVIADIVGAVGMVYVSDIDFFIAEKRAGQIEFVAHLLELPCKFFVHFHSPL